MTSSKRKKIKRNIDVHAVEQWAKGEFTPCEPCSKNNLPNCGNEWCCTRSNDEKEWIVDCKTCGSKSETSWNKAANDGCPICCSFKVSIYHRKNLQKK